MAKFFCFCFLLFVNFLQFAAANSTAIILNDTETKISLARHLETFKAEENGLTIQQVSSTAYNDQFKPNHSTVTNYGYHKKDFWIRFNVSLASSTNWYLSLDHLVLGEVEIFILPKNHKITTKNKDEHLLIPVEEHRTPAWRLRLPENQVFSIYLRLKNPKNSLIFSINLMQESAFIEYSNYRYAFLTMILAGITTLAIYNLFLAFSLRDKGYVILVVFIVLLSINIYRTANFPSFLSGILINPESRYHAGLSYLIYFFAAYYWYIIHRNTDIWLERCAKALAWLSLLITILAVIYPLSSNLTTYLSLISFSTISFLTIRAIIKGHKNVLSNFLAMLCLIVSVAIYTPLNTGMFPNYPIETQEVGQLGILLAILLLSLNHADRTRQLRAQAERAEINNKATHSFLTTMSHELRTPMHTVLGANELLKSTSLDETQKNYLNSQELAAHQMLTLVNDMLDTARLDSSQLPIVNYQPFDLHQLLDDLEKMFSVQASQKQLIFVVRAKNIPAVPVVGDAQHLKQILTNLLGNAIKYTQSGKIILQLKIEASSAQHEENNIHFAVHDSGPGIPAEHHTLLFQSFYQTDSSRSRSKDGAGLGLAISYKLVQQMGGELQLKSTPGQGSCFFFTLNLPECNEQVITKQNQQKAQSPQVAPVSPRDLLNNKPASHTSPPLRAEANNRSLSGLNILLVDDGELNLMIGEQLLILHGANVALAQSGKDALKTLADQSIDLVLMDVSMPGMDGYQTTQSIRQNKEFQRLPIIALTAHAISGERERCLAAGMDDYLSKPFQTEQLLKLVERYFPANSNSTG